MLITRHNFFFTFFRFSLFHPILIRLVKYLLFISLNFCLNAVLFNDQYIEEMSDTKTNQNIVIAKNDFLYSLIKLIWKSIISALLCWIPLIILNILTTTPANLNLRIFEKINTKNAKEVQEIYDHYRSAMKIRFFIFFFFSIALILLSWYYTIVFCSIYRYSSIVWFYGGIISFILDFVFQLIKISIILLVRSIAITHPKSR